MRSKAILALLSAIFVTAGASAAAQPFLRDQSDFSTSIAAEISENVVANYLTIPATTRLDTLTVWLADDQANDDGVLNGFSGRLGWAIFWHDLGPYTVIYSGTDFTPELVDTGVQSAGNHDIFVARIDLDGQPVVGPGTYWLAIHEGAWGSANDGTSIFWLGAMHSSGVLAKISPDETNPQPASWSSLLVDPAFTIEGDPLHWGQTGLDILAAWNITSYVAADDFALAETTSLGSLDVWLRDGLENDNGRIDSFSGTLSWGIYSDAVGEPGELLLFGSDSTPIVVDTGLQLDPENDAARVRIELDPPPQLAAGEYWLVLHEGTWASPRDATRTYWLATSTQAGETLRYSTHEIQPRGWKASAGADDQLAFVLSDDLLFAAGFDAGVTCAWSGEVLSTNCPALDSIFADGFESGDFSGWTSMTGVLGFSQRNSSATLSPG